MTECNASENPFQDDFFPNVKSRKIEVDFNGGNVSSTGGGGGGYGGGHALGAVDDRHLAEDFARLDGIQFNPLAFHLLEDDDLTLVEDIGGIAGIALAEQHRTGWQG